MIFAAVVAATLCAAPDVFVVTVDTLRADRLGCYGYAQDTSPNIDRFAQDALLFEDCLCEVPLTGPSFGSMMTSRYPRLTGVTRNGMSMPETVPTLAERFKQAGYQTFCVQSNWTLKAKLSGLGRGFDTYDDDFHRRRWGVIKSERYADEVTGNALELLKKRDPNRPLFFWIHYSDPHAPYLLHPEFDPSAKAYPGKANPDSTRRRYDSEIAYADHYIGKLLEALPKDNAYVMVGADHGESLFEHDYLGHGRRIYQTCIHVPLMLRGPSITPGRSTDPAHVLDIAPTLLTAAGLTPAPGMLGRNLLTAPTSAPARYIETYGGAVPNLPGAKAIMGDRPPMRQGVVLDGWKLIHHDNDTELYNLKDDPKEEKNLVKQQPDKVKELMHLVDEFDTRTTKGEANQAPLNADDVDALKSLGYIR
jgi:arylsulfatase A-like enzyme